jgi:hypothetical protein
LNLPPGPFGVLSFLRQTIRYLGERAAEERIALHSYIVNENGHSSLSAPEQAALIRQLVQASRVRDPLRSNLIGRILSAEVELANELRRLDEADFENRVRHVVWPIAALMIT